MIGHDPDGLPAAALSDAHISERYALSDGGTCEQPARDSNRSDVQPVCSTSIVGDDMYPTRPLR